jgi:ankyrin repeat protein
MIRFLENVSEEAISDQRVFRVLLSSRHYPHITVHRCVDMVLEDQHGHSRDIDKYLKSELKATGGLAVEIRTEMQERASGIFLWIVLAVQILNKAFDRGQVDFLRRKLREIPDDLNELFRSILTRDHEDLNIMKLCLQWVLYSKRPMKPEELYYAILSGIGVSDTEPEQSFLWSPDNISTETMDRFIVNHSKGLAEVTRSKTRNVQFIHESVRDFLLKNNGISQLWPDLKDNPTGSSHDRLKECCSTYLKSDIPNHLDIPDPLPLAKTAEAHSLRQDALRQFPFLDYALGNIFTHADDAQAEGVSQQHFLEEYEHALCKWVRLNNIFEKHQVRRHSVDIDLKYIFAERNHSRLIELMLKDSPATLSSSGRWENCIFAAIANDHHQVFEVLVRRDSQMHPHPHRCPFPYPGRKTLFFLLKHGKPSLVQKFLTIYFIDDMMKPTDRTKMFTQAISKGHQSIVRLLLDRGADVNTVTAGYGSAFIAAVRSGHASVVRLLLDRGADINAEIVIYGSALAAAAAGSGGESVVRLLLDRGADINAEIGVYGSALAAAAAGRSGESVVKLLLDRGAEINAKIDGQYGSALAAAAARSFTSSATVKLLLDRGADVNAKIGGQYGSALAAAAAAAGRSGTESVVRLLLDRGADINAKIDGQYGSALAAAAARSFTSSATVKLLLDRGADVNAKIGGQYGSALAAAAVAAVKANNCHESPIRLLIDRGADINAQIGGNYGSALAAAVVTAIRYPFTSKAIVELLLDRGADVNAQIGGTYGSVLAAAKSASIYNLLLGRGATEIPHGMGNSPQ